MISQDLADIQSRFKDLRNEASEMADFDDRTQRINALEQEEMSLINTPGVWGRIAKLHNAKFIERSYQFHDNFGPDKPIAQYLVNEAELSFFDQTGLIVFSRHLFDLPDADLDMLISESANKMTAESPGRFSALMAVLHEVIYASEAEAFYVSRKPSDIALKKVVASIDELNKKLASLGWEKAGQIHRWDSRLVDLWYKDGSFVAGWLDNLER